MKIRKANNNSPVINNQKDDKTVVDGYLSPSEIEARGQLSAEKTIEFMNRVYPKSPEFELKERELMLDDKLNQILRETKRENSEKVAAAYSLNTTRQRIINIQNEIKALNSKIDETRRINYVYEKERKIKELEKIINESGIKINP